VVLVPQNISIIIHPRNRGLPGETSPLYTEKKKDGRCQVYWDNPWLALKKWSFLLEEKLFAGVVAPFSAIINCKRNQIQWVQYTRVNFFY
jgi:hypothetical protein